jgi:hypothetical protein
MMLPFVVFGGLVWASTDVAAQPFCDEIQKVMLVVDDSGQACGVTDAWIDAAASRLNAAYTAAQLYACTGGQPLRSGLGSFMKSRRTESCQRRQHLEYKGPDCGTLTSAVLDKFYGGDACGMTEAGLRTFAAELRDLRSSPACLIADSAIPTIESYIDEYRPVVKKRCGVQMSGALTQREAFIFFLTASWQAAPDACPSPGDAALRSAVRESRIRETVSRSEYDQVVGDWVAVELLRMHNLQPGATVLNRFGGDTRYTPETSAAASRHLSCMAPLLLIPFDKPR